MRCRRIFLFTLMAVISAGAYAQSCDVPDHVSYTDTSVFLYELFSQADDTDTAEPRWNGTCHINDDTGVWCYCKPAGEDDCDWFEDACAFLGGSGVPHPYIKSCVKNNNPS